MASPRHPLISEPLRREANAAAERAAAHLVDLQADDGYWRDYALVPGASTDWVTAVVAHALAGASGSGPVRAALERTQATVRANGRPMGWGFNANVAPDADSTAWVVRWFCRTGAVLPLDPIATLAQYLGPTGGAKTFASDARYGTWVQEHADVTALLGLAMHEAGAGPQTVMPLRQWLLDARTDEGLWHAFWWSFDTYAVVHGLEFLAATGALPRALVEAALASLMPPSSTQSTMEMAYGGMLAGLLDVCADAWMAALLHRQLSHGGWPPSRTLRVPQQAGAGPEGPTYEDVAGVMSTAVALRALGAMTRSTAPGGQGVPCRVSS